MSKPTVSFGPGRAMHSANLAGLEIGHDDHGKWVMSLGSSDSIYCLTLGNEEFYGLLVAAGVTSNTLKWFEPTQSTPLADIENAMTTLKKAGLITISER